MRPVDSLTNIRITGQRATKRSLCSESSREIKLAIHKNLLPSVGCTTVTLPNGKFVTSGEWTPFTTKGLLGTKSPVASCSLVLEGIEENTGQKIQLPGRKHVIMECSTCQEAYLVVVDNKQNPVARLVKQGEGKKDFVLKPFKQGQDNYAHLNKGFLESSEDASRRSLKELLVKANIPPPPFPVFLHSFGNKRLICNKDGDVLAELYFLPNKMGFSIESTLGDDNKPVNVILENMMQKLDLGDQFTPDKFHFIHIQGKNYIVDRHSKFIFETIEIKSKGKRKLIILSQNILQEKKLGRRLELPELILNESVLAPQSIRPRTISISKLVEHLAYTLGIDKDTFTKFFSFGSFTDDKQRFLYLKDYPTLPLLQLQYYPDKKTMGLEDIVLPTYNLSQTFPRHEYRIQGYEIAVSYIGEKYFKTPADLKKLLTAFTKTRDDTKNIKLFIQIHHTLAKMLEGKQLRVLENVPISLPQESNNPVVSLCEFIGNCLTLGLLRD